MYGPSESEWRLFLFAFWVGVTAIVLAIVCICGYGLREVGRVVWKPAPDAVSCKCAECRCCDACPGKRGADRE